MGMTATQLGSVFGRGAAATNVLLRDHGFLEGSPGAWRPTELGEQFAKWVDRDNGYGGYAHRSWGWLTWSDGLIDALKASIEANPDGIVPSVSATVETTVTASTTGAGGQTLGKYKWAVMAAVGVVTLAAPVVKSVRSRLAERKATAATDAASDVAPQEDSAAADSATEDPSIEDD